jgi:hypothetical protein
MTALRSPMAALLLASLTWATAVAHARDGTPAPVAPRAASEAVPGTEAAAVPKTPEAKVEHLVTEDSQVRIEETRVRGVTTRIVVHSKLRGMGSYAIQPANPALDREDDPAAGKRLWSWGF